MPHTSRCVNNLVTPSQPDVPVAQPLHSGPAKRPRQWSGSMSDTQTAVPCPRLHSSKSSTTAAHLPSTLAHHQPMVHLLEEEIIIDDPSSSDTESSDGLLRHRSRRHEAEADDAMQLNSTSEETVCRYCKKAHDTNPVAWTQTYSKRDPTFQYSLNTGTSALRGHINRHHILEYLALVEANKWQVWLESVKAVMARGYTLNEIREALAEGGALASLPPRHSEALSMNSANPSDHPLIPPFSLEQLHDHLVAFIVADDQSLNVVECKEFRQLLLLLHQDLKDSQIPHRTKIREDIISAWQ
ncbi:hypothetical protein BDN67DRAFT_1016868 [Paxillus ammoniavirescens]|nr:hypothetical protein BDN67DRAFT_1016868 [Paxillus ammoniavirescens]